jgi:hypothetical protein
MYEKKNFFFRFAFCCCRYIARRWYALQSLEILFVFIIILTFWIFLKQLYDLSINLPSSKPTATHAFLHFKIEKWLGAPLISKQHLISQFYYFKNNLRPGSKWLGLGNKLLTGYRVCIKANLWNTTMVALSIWYWIATKQINGINEIMIS